jgi:Right handed beta helix region
MYKLLILSLLAINLNAAKVVKLEQNSSVTDATEILQKAINSKTAKIIIGKKGSPWLTQPLELRSNLEIVLEKGAVLKAKPGAYKHLNDCLLNAVGCKNIIIRGPGSLVMNKKDYQNASNYQHSEWRHAINLKSCENVRIENLKIIGSGGDGIYIGSRPHLKYWKGTKHYGKHYAKLPNYCKNIIIKNCFIDEQHRQGISVISVENLTISNCQLNNTNGTSPMAGIDFEPNNGSQRLVNCRLEKCTMQGNKNYGFLAYIKIQNTSKPLSITVKNCVIKGGGKGILLGKPVAKRKINNPAEGFIKFINCRIENTGDAGIELKDFYSDGFKAIFENCKFINTAAKQPGRSPIMLYLSPGTTKNIGAAEFINTTVIDAKKRPLMQMSNLAGKPIAERISGTVIYNGNKVNMADYIKKHKMDQPNLSKIADVKLSSLLPVGGYTLKPRRKSQPRLIIRQKVAYLISANKNQAVKFNLRFQLVSRRYKPLPMSVKMISPSGKKITLTEAKCQKKANVYSFTAKEKGVYAIYCNPKGNKLSLTNSNVPYSIMLPQKNYLAMYRPAGRIYFGVPAGVTEFSIEIGGQGSETVNAAIYIGRKKLASANNISAPQKFKISCKASNKLRYGSIIFAKAVEDAMLKIPVPLLPIIAADKPELMVQTENPTP